MAARIDLTRDFESVVRTMPPFPNVVLQLLDVLRKDDLSLDTLVRIAKKDAVIAGNILARANRIRRAHVQPDLNDPFSAASLIGLNQLRSIVVASGMNRFLSAGGADQFLYRHSIAVAITAQELSGLSGISRETAYVAGVLHDVGQICYCKADPVAFEAVYLEAAIDGKLLERETETFGIDHCVLGAKLAEHWNLPADFVSTILTHHDDSAVTSKLQATIVLAESLARALDIPSSPKNRLLKLNAPAAAELGVDWGHEEMRDCFGRCRARYRQAISGA